jgi:glycine hydroxymethyltransferase
LAHLIADVLAAPEDQAVIARVAQTVQAICKRLPVYGRA